MTRNFWKALDPHIQVVGQYELHMENSQYLASASQDNQDEVTKMCKHKNLV